MRKAGWDEEQKDYLTITNLLSTIILLGVSWATCSTWFNGPFVLPCAGVVWIALTLIFFKHPVSAFVIAISMVVAVIAYPQVLSPSSLSSFPLPTQQSDSQQHVHSQRQYESPANPQQSDTTKQTQKEWPNEKQKEYQSSKYNDPPKYSEYPEPKYEAPTPAPVQYKEPEPISRDDIILGPGVEVARGSKPTITLSGGGMICEGEEPNIAILFTMTGKGPWQFSYYLEGSDDVHFTTSSTPIHKVYVNKPGVYKLSKRGEDAVCELYDVQGEAVVTLQKKPTIEFATSNAEVCEGETGKLEAILSGTPPWTVTYNDGEKEYTQVITSSPMKWQSKKPVTYTIASLADKYCKNTDLRARASIDILPLPSISLASGKCYGDDVIINANGVPPFTIELDNPQRTFTLPDHTLSYPTTRDSADLPVRAHAHSDRLMFRLLRDAKCAVATSVIFAELHELPTASFKDTSKIVKTGEKAALEIVLTGTPPWDLWYTSPSGLKNSRIKQSPYTLLHHEEGKYTLLNVTDTYCKNSANPGKSELEIFTFSPPSVSVSSLNTLCEGSTAHINIDFAGKSPFTYHYSFGGQRFTKTTSSSRATFSTTEPGNFRLDEFSDFFNYTVRPEAQILREVKFVKPPNFSTDAPAYSCDNAEVDVTISITGQAPFSVQYMLNQTSRTKGDIEGRFTFPIPTPTLVTLSHVRDRFGCDARILPDKETVHVPSKSLPNMEVTGGDCSPITLRFQGVPPFKVDYTFSGLPNQDKITKSDEFIEYSVQFTDAGAYQFLAISDSYCKRPFTSNLRTILQTPTAELDLVRTHFKVCEIEPKSPEDDKLEIKLTGIPPFDVTILTPDGATDLCAISTNSVSVPVTKGGEYEILKVSDANCRGAVVEEKSKKLVVMDYHTTPTVTISGGGEICQADMLDLQFDMTGTGPWNIECSNGQHTFSFESKTRSYTHHLQTSEYTAPQEKSGTYRVTSISDSNCKGIPGTSSTDVVIRPIPTARIQGGGVVCQGEETILKISLTGTPPWSISISRNTSDHKIPMKDIMQSEIEVKTDEPGFFYIDFIQDSYCKYKRMSVPVYRG